MKILESYRRRIDALDKQIVDLLAQRIAVIREVGELKFREGIPAILQDRVIEVRENAAAHAEGCDIDPDFVRQLYTMLIDYSCNLEEEIKADLAKSTAKATGT